jgi:hypothetical protein
MAREASAGVLTQRQRNNASKPGIVSTVPG